MAFMMNKLAMIYFCDIILEKLKKICQKSLWNLGAHNTCMRIVLVCTLYSIKYGSSDYLTEEYVF